ncbi:MAG: DNA polymerase III subunit gamma/tau [Gammaproteobacteria bacterium]
MARKWRPKTFETTVGQETVLRALEHALSSKKLHHAYLFTGTRGVGKTTIARMLAKCLVCEQGPSPKPCGTCPACLDFDAGCFIDFIEVDAASRTKVEDTRELLENITYAPQMGAYKIYLIDEVHMLSGHSFNALLKTLEEPPSHVKFLLATTDPQKMPITVLSRCIQFNLRPLTVEQISEHLIHILSQEQVIFDKAALTKIAQAAQGSMRDALSILEQALNLGAGCIDATEVAVMLGISPVDYLLNLLEALLLKNPASVLEATQVLLKQVQDASNLLVEFLQVLQDIKHYQLLKTQPPNYQEQELQKLEALSSRISTEDWLAYFRVAMQGQKEMQYSPDPPMTVEVSFLRMLSQETSEQPRPIIQQVIQQIAPALPISTPESRPLEQAPAMIPKIIQKTIKAPEFFDWSSIIPKLDLSYFAKDLAMHSAIVSKNDYLIEAVAPKSCIPFAQDIYKQEIEQKLSQYLGKNIKLSLKMIEDAEFERMQSPASDKAQKAKVKKAAFVAKAKSDPFVQTFTSDQDLNIRFEEDFDEKPF